MGNLYRQNVAIQAFKVTHFEKILLSLLENLKTDSVEMFRYSTLTRQNE